MYLLRMNNMKIVEVTSPAQSPEKLRLDALKRQKDTATKALKAQQARNKIAAGQATLAKVAA